MIRPQWIFLSLTLAAACEDDDREARAMEAATSRSKSKVCARGGGEPGDPVSAEYFPKTVGHFCIDPHTETRVYGDKASAELDEACREQFAGQCDLYESFGLRRVVTLRYIDGRDASGVIEVVLSRFRSPEAAYGFFTHRTVGRADPTDVSAEPIASEGAGAVDDRGAYVWRGPHVAELSYEDELLSPERLREASREVLPSVVRALAKRLAGPPALPEAARRLPEEHRLELGVRYEHRDVLGVSGVGAGAIGYYQQGKKRYRIFVVVRPDEASAEDVVETLERLDGARELEDMRFDVLRVPRQSTESAPRIEWLVSQRGKYVYGVGDEEHAVRGLSPAQQKQASLGEREKLAVLRRVVLGGAPEPAGQ